ncbi:MAG: amino acid ABC transporter substrate-binding protein, partial [Planctomycetota bacterium]
MKIFSGKSNKGDRLTSKSRSNSHLMMALMSLSAGVLLTSCQGGETTGSGNDNSNDNGLKLGTLAPTTGDLSSIGQNWPAAVQLAVDTIN